MVMCWGCGSGGAKSGVRSAGDSSSAYRADDVAFVWEGDRQAGQRILDGP
jgi:hypothetical protein